MSFGSPLLLLTLLVVPLVLALHLLAQRRRMRYAVAFTNLDVLAGVVGRTRPWRRLIPIALFLLALAALCVGLARPKVTVPVPREEATVVLVIDTSGSMLADDVRPTRLGAAQQAVRRFLERLPPRFRVGLVSFGEEAQVVAPVTTDRSLVRNALGYLAPERGTAIGDALARAAELGRTAAGPAGTGDGDAPPVTILFLSDGAQTTGFLEPLAGAERAKAAGIPVYTVALGTPNGVVDFNFGGFTSRRPVPPDPATLRQVANLTGGEFFSAPSAEALNAAYDKLGSQVTHTHGRREATFAFLGGAAALLLAAGGLSALWSSRLP